MSSSPDKISRYSLKRIHKPEFSTSIWRRRWRGVEYDFLEVQREFAKARMFAGFGLRTPFSIYLAPNCLETHTLVSGQTLAEQLAFDRIEHSAKVARSVGEQLLMGLARLHYSAGQPHGAVNPFNVGIDSQGNIFLWSTPTAWIEACHTPPEEQDKFLDQPYRSMEVSNWKPTVETDFFAVGRVMMELLPEEKRARCQAALSTSFDPPEDRASQNIVDIVVNAQRVLPAHRYRSALEMALVINPDTQLKQLRIEDGLVSLREGIKHYHMARYDEALEHWQDAATRDWLSVAAWNNLGISELKRQNFEKALAYLKKAHSLDESHSVVCCNLGLCFIAMGEREEAEPWVIQAERMRPDYVPALIAMSNYFFVWSMFDKAVEYATLAIYKDPTNRSARWQFVRLLERLGREDEAAERREDLTNFEYRVPYADSLVDDMKTPAWGKARPSSGEGPSSGQSPPNRPGPDGTGSPVPVRPYPPSSGSHNAIPMEEWEQGMLAD